MSILTYRGTELHSLSAGYWFDVTAGFFDEFEVRGKDVTIPGKAGRLVTNRVADRRQITLDGWVFGAGAGETAIEANQLALANALHTIFDPTAAPGALIVYGPYLGIASGHHYALNARYLNGTPDPTWEPGMPRRYVVTLECVDSPPNWVYT